MTSVEVKGDKDRKQKQQKVEIKVQTRANDNVGIKINVPMGDGEERKQKECSKGDRRSTDFLHAPTEALLPRNIIIQAAYFNLLAPEFYI
jgi:hypothetical protein